MEPKWRPPVTREGRLAGVFYVAMVVAFAVILALLIL